MSLVLLAATNTDDLMGYDRAMSMFIGMKTCQYLEVKVCRHTSCYIIVFKSDRLAV